MVDNKDGGHNNCKESIWKVFVTEKCECRIIEYSVTRVRDCKTVSEVIISVPSTLKYAHGHEKNFGA